MSRLRPAPRLNLPEGFSLAGALEVFDLEASRRADGWTPAKQRDFLAAVAEGTTVQNAAAAVGLSPQSAYALRQRAAGATFAVGWHAAMLLQRQKLVDDLTARALEGQVDTRTRADGSLAERRRHDNRLGLALLARLDRIAEGQGDRHGEAEAARLVAGEWQRYLDLVERDASPAEAGLFLAARATTTPGREDAVDALAPVMTLARADLYTRTRAGIPDEVDTADLDPAARAGWSAEQWARAEAVGLFVLAPEPAAKNALPCQPSQHSQAEEEGEDEDEQEEPVWFDEGADEWRTCFAPPPGIYVWEEGRYGEHGYKRSLTREEVARVEPARLHAEAERYRAAAARRDAWFAARPPAPDGARTPIVWKDDDEFADDVFEGEGEDLNEAPPLVDPIDREDQPAPTPAVCKASPAGRTWEEIEAEEQAAWARVREHGWGGPPPESEGSIIPRHDLNDAGHRLPPAASDGAGIG